MATKQGAWPPEATAKVLGWIQAGGEQRQDREETQRGTLRALLKEEVPVSPSIVEEDKLRHCPKPGKAEG